MPKTLFSGWFEQLNRGEICHLPDVSGLPEANSAERALLVSGGIRSLLALPLRAGNELWGLALFVNPTALETWPEQNWQILRVASAILGNALAYELAEQQVYKLSHAVEQSSSMFILTDARGDIEYVNPRFTQVTGYPIEEVIGKNPRFLKSGECSPEEYQQLWKAVTTGGEWRGEFHNKKKNGAYYWVSASITAVKNASGAITHFLAVEDDITERKQVEDALKKREEELYQSQKLNAVGLLAGGIAHDFNNNLAVIFGYVEQCLDDVREDTRLHRYLTRIHNVVHRAAELTQKLLLFSSKQPITRRPTNLNDIVANLMKMLMRVLGEDIAICLELAENPWFVGADEGSIDQVITNLAVNARDAMPKGGTLTLRTRNVTISEAESQHYLQARKGRFVCLEVEDTGVGMTAEVQAHMFEPFFTTKAPGKGTGLGLSVIYGIVQAHGGWLRAESKVQSGTRFEIYLPIAESHVQPPEFESHDASPCHYNGAGERILVVEDETFLREMIEHLLVKAGYVVQPCASISEGLRALIGEPFDLILSDVGLPDGRGTDLVFDALKRQPKLSVIMMSGYADGRNDRKRIRKAGLTFLQKPMPAGRLLQHVRSVLDQRNPSSKVAGECL